MRIVYKTVVALVIVALSAGVLSAGGQALAAGTVICKRSDGALMPDSFCTTAKPLPSCTSSGDTAVVAQNLMTTQCGNDCSNPDCKAGSAGAPPGYTLGSCWVSPTQHFAYWIWYKDVGITASVALNLMTTQCGNDCNNPDCKAGSAGAPPGYALGACWLSPTQHYAYWLWYTGGGSTAPVAQNLMTTQCGNDCSNPDCKAGSAGAPSGYTLGSCWVSPTQHYAYWIWYK